MFTGRTKRLTGVVAFGLTLLWSAAAFSRPAETAYRLDNGMEVILKESHSAPMVGTVIFVRSGSKYESRHENGMTHLLEHLLFDGTTNLSREELDGSIHDLGGYINAFTRKDLTAYLVLLPKQYIEYGLTVQADMLFNSLIPEEELTKERQVVIEEINRADDQPGARAESFFTEKAYAGTDYSRPVLGFQPLIENIPRPAIIAYWKKHYTPDNMILLVIGDFETDHMKTTIANIFNRFQQSSPGPIITPSDLHRRLAQAKQRSDNLVGRMRHDTVADVSSTYINFSFAAPVISDPDYLPFDLLTGYLDLEEISPLRVALQGGTQPLADEVAISLSPREEFSRLEISVITDRPDKSDSIVHVVLTELGKLGTSEIDPEVVAGLKTIARCEAVYNAEKLSHYGILIAPLMSGGWEFIQNYPDLIDTVQVSHISAAADRWLGKPNYVATVVRPVDTTEGLAGSAAFEPDEITAGEVIAHFDTADVTDYDLSPGATLEYPNIDSVRFELVDHAAYHREVLTNGLTVIVKSSPDSRVLAVNVLGKNRMANEPEGKAGITDLVNRCLERGTTNRDAGRFARELAAIGAKLTLYDNPWIPFDDRYTTRSYSFIKFETIDQFAPGGFELFCDLLSNPAFDSTEVEGVRQEMLGVLRRDANSPTKVAREAFFAGLFAGEPFARPVMGTPASIAAITVDDLKTHHRRFYQTSNMILTVATSRDTAEVMSWVRDGLGKMPDIGHAMKSPGTGEPGVSTERHIHIELDKEQIDIYAGGRLPGANEKDEIDLAVAASVLSSRLFQKLREKQGLAYSTSAAAMFDREFGWYHLTIGTAARNYRRALDGLALQTEKLALDGPTAAEVRTARNRMWGRLMSAKLSRINQAYYLGVNEFLGREVSYDQRLLELLDQVDTQSVRRVASRYFNPGTWLIATAGRTE